jgi:hypothetical protein
MSKRHDHPKRLCGALNRRGDKCRRFAVPGRTRCRFHGGLSSGPSRQFLVLMSDEELKRRIDNMQAGRGRWVADLKARGEPCPCGRRPRGYAAPTGRLALDAKAHKADATRLQAPYRRWWRDHELEAARQATLEKQRAELRRIAEENDNPAKRPNETWEENAMRYACIMERLRRERGRSFNALIESRLRKSGFF